MINDMDTVVPMGYTVQIPLMKDSLLLVANKWLVAFCPFRDVLSFRDLLQSHNSFQEFPTDSDFKEL